MKMTMTVKEVAEYLGVHEDSIYYLVKEQKIPHFRIKSKILFSQESIDQWIKDQVRTSKKDTW